MKGAFDGGKYNGAEVPDEKLHIRDLDWRLFLPGINKQSCKKNERSRIQVKR